LKILYVYRDWTLEDTPRCFYVGKGDNERVRRRDRNDYWKRVAAKHGHRREIILSTKDPEFASYQEVEWIAMMRTFHYDNEDNWGCNFTRGGEGNYGGRVSLETKIKIGNSRRGKKNSAEAIETRSRRVSGPGNPMFNKRHSQSAKLKMSAANLGVKLPADVIKRGSDHPLFGRKHDQEWIDSVSGENHHRTRLTWNDVDDIRRAWDSGEVSQTELAIKYGLKKAAIWKILNELTWKRISGS
jgi:hypothetical protein